MSKNFKMPKVPKVDKTPQEVYAEEQKKLVEARQEKTVVDARKKVLPILKAENMSIDQTKLVCDLLAVAISQGQFELLKEHKVEDLKLLDFISKDYPQSAVIKKVLNKINTMPMLDAINTMQWMTSKINSMIEAENKARKFEDLKLDF